MATKQREQKRQQQESDCGLVPLATTFDRAKTEVKREREACKEPKEPKETKGTQGTHGTQGTISHGCLLCC